MDKSEAGKLGAKKSLETLSARMQKRRDKYNLNPKRCQGCNTVLSWKKKRNKYCNRSCSATHNNLGIVRNGSKVEKISCLLCNSITKNPKFCSKQCCAEYAQRKVWAEIDRSGISNSTPATTKKYMIHKFGHKCCICNLTEWCGQEAPLVLDHINGDATDNRIANLRLVCGNCDMQLPTYKSKNIGNGRYNRRKRYSRGQSY